MFSTLRLRQTRVKRCRTPYGSLFCVTLDSQLPKGEWLKDLQPTKDQESGLRKGAEWF